MTILATCTACSREYRLKDEMAGRTFSCKDCGEKVRVGSGAASASTKPAGGRRSREAESDPWSEPLPPRRRTSGSSGNAGASRRAASAGKSSKAPLYIGIGVGVAALIVVAVLFFPKRDSSNFVAGDSSTSPQATDSGNSTGGTAAAAGGGTSNSSSPGRFPLEPDPVNISWAAPREMTLAIGSELEYPPTGTPVVVVRDLVAGKYTFTSWNLATGQTLGQLKGFPIVTGERSLSPDGKTVAVLDGPRKNVQIWSFETGKMIQTIAAEQGTATVNDMICLSSSRVLTYTLTQNGSSFEKQLKLYDAVTGQLLKTRSPEGIIDLNSLAVSFGGKYFVSSEVNEGSTIYRTETLEDVIRIPVPSLQFAMPSGAAFNAAGDQLSVAWTDTKTTVIVTTKLIDGSVSEVSVPGHLNLSPITGDSYSGPGLEWLPDGTGWLLSGRTIIDANSKLRVWTIDTGGFNGTIRRQLLQGGLMVYAGGVNLDTGAVKNVSLKVVNWPKEDIDRSISAATSGGDAKLRRGAVVALKVEIGTLKYGPPEETQKKLEEAFQQRLAADGMASTGSPAAVLTVTYSEADGKEMFSQGRGLPGFPTPPTQPPSGTPIQSTVGLIKLALQISGEAQPVWSTDLLINPSVLLIRGNADAQAARDAMFEMAQRQITSAAIPYFVPSDSALPLLPGQTIYSAE